MVSLLKFGKNIRSNYFSFHQSISSQNNIFHSLNSIPSSFFFKTLYHFFHIRIFCQTCMFVQSIYFIFGNFKKIICPSCRFATLPYFGSRVRLRPFVSPFAGTLPRLWQAVRGLAQAKTFETRQHIFLSIIPLSGEGTGAPYQDFPYRFSYSLIADSQSPGFSGGGMKGYKARSVSMKSRNSFVSKSEVHFCSVMILRRSKGFRFFTWGRYLFLIASFVFASQIFARWRGIHGYISQIASAIIGRHTQ